MVTALMTTSRKTTGPVPAPMLLVPTLLTPEKAGVELTKELLVWTAVARKAE